MSPGLDSHGMEWNVLLNGRKEGRMNEKAILFSVSTEQQQAGRQEGMLPSKGKARWHIHVYL